MSELLNVKQMARSKQRHSYNKDRYHSKRGRGRGSVSNSNNNNNNNNNAPGVGRGRGFNNNNNSNNNEESDDDEDDEDEEERLDTSKFRRRAVVAQDKKFELDETVDDDEIPKVDIDFLLKQPMGLGGAETTFKFTDEREWDVDSLTPSATIVIDCKKIARQLNQLSVSKRLGIDLSPFGEAPLVDEDPLDTNTLLKTIVIYPEYSSSSISPLTSSHSRSSSPTASILSSSSSSSSSANKSAEDSFLDEILNQPTKKETTPSLIVHTPSIPPLSASSEIKKDEKASGNTINNNNDNKKDGKNVSVEDLEDWLDSVI